MGHAKLGSFRVMGVRGGRWHGRLGSFRKMWGGQRRGRRGIGFVSHNRGMRQEAIGTGGWMRLGSFCAFGARHAVPVLELGLFCAFGDEAIGMRHEGGGNWVRFAFFGCWPCGIGFVSHFWVVVIVAVG